MSEDNLKAAMDHEADTTLKDLAVSKAGDDVADKQVLIRATEYDRNRWKASADAKGVSMSEWIRTILNGAAKDTLDCSHPLNRRRYYPWSEFCLECNQRLR